MSSRLAAALIERIKLIDARTKFLMIEAVPNALAHEINRRWDDGDQRLPVLAIASPTAADFGSRGLVLASAATLRNEYPNGVCVVICEGAEVAERQSINLFSPISPADLLEDKNRLMLLGEAVQPVRRDGPVAAVREAIVTMPRGLRPSATAVAAYFDAIAGGADALESLPLIGGFRDSALPADIRGDRVRENLLLASRRRADDVIRAEDYSLIRRRADRVLGRPGSSVTSADRFMELLENGSDEILAAVSYDEARETLTTINRGLSQEVRESIKDFQVKVREEDPDRVDLIPWMAYEDDARDLDRTDQQRQAAQSLLTFDETEDGGVFERRVRLRLLALLRDRTINATPGSCPEVGLARAIRSIQGAPTSVEVLAPGLDGEPSGGKQARDWLTLAVARMRLAPILAVLVEVGCEIDPELEGGVLGGVDLDQARRLFSDASLVDNELPSLKLRIRSDASSVEVGWAPDGDDAALLRCALEFSEGSAIALRVPSSPDSRPFASCDFPEHVRPSNELRPLVQRLSDLARDVLADGLSATRLQTWADEWVAQVNTSRGFEGGASSEQLSIAGCVEGRASGGLRVIGMGPLSAPKAEWLGDYLRTAEELVRLALGIVTEGEHVAEAGAFEVACQALRDVTSAHCPAFVRVIDADAPLLPSKETRAWSVFGGNPGLLNFERHAMMSIDRVVHRLLRLQPEAAGHFRCLAYGPGSAALLLNEAVDIAGRVVEGVRVGTVEVFVVGVQDQDDEAFTAALRKADEAKADAEAGDIRLRYVDSLDLVGQTLGEGRLSVHFALFTGLTDDDHLPQIDHVEIELRQAVDPTEVLFAPRLSLRPDREQRAVLCGPAPSQVGASWLRLGQAMDDAWPEDEGRVTAPEMRVRAIGFAEELRILHSVAMWVATVDRYASRESLERALNDDVAILHQERRLGSDSPIGMVVSQQAGGPVDRAIGRSLRGARIVADRSRADSIGQSLRKVAAQGYGVLALEAATSGTGINELVGHVVGFSMLGTESTPWPLPPGCRLLLISLDEHAGWFLGQKRADLLAIAVDTIEKGLHGAVIEVKARRSDGVRAEAEALDQLRRTLLATRFAAQPDRSSIASRVWLNRIGEALYSACRESRIRLSRDELDAIETFREGRGTLEWAGLGLVFGPDLEDGRRVQRQEIGGDHVPIAMRSVRLTQARLEDAVRTDLRHLRTAAPVETPLGGGRVRRRPESGVDRQPRDERGDERASNTDSPESEDVDERGPTDPTGADAPTGSQEPVGESINGQNAGNHQGFSSRVPVLGHDLFTGDSVLWRVTGDSSLSNGHVQVWGSSGAGKTQFVKMLLAQLAGANGSRFGIADFKNDYGSEEGEDFPASVGAEFLDLWGQPGAPYNPLALADGDDQNTRIIEFRDSIEQAVAAYQRIGNRQKRAIENALRAAYADVRGEGRWPTMLDLNRHLNDDIEHILGDLTRYEIFSDGPPLGAVIDRNVVFGLNRIPGNGQTTMLAAAFILATISLTIQDLPPIANAIRYVVVIDEAHRVSKLRAVDMMIKEGRSKGLAVILATQSPADLTETIDTNAQTRICFRLSDAVVAAQAARKLDPNDATLSDRIRTLESGEAFVSLGGQSPRLLRMLQHYRDRGQLGRD
jgi:hypothetical protein